MQIRGIGEHLKTPLKCSIIYGLTYLQEFKTHLKFNLFVGRLNGLSHGFRVHAAFQKTMRLKLFTLKLCVLFRISTRFCVDFDSMWTDSEKICSIIAEKYPDETVILMGHGTEHRANEIYTRVEEICRKSGYKNIYTATVEAKPTIDDVIDSLKADGISAVTLMPLMLVAGDHASNDMAGDEPDSWKNKLEEEGFEVKCVLKGLGKYPEIKDIYCEHIRTLIKEGK